MKLLDSMKLYGGLLLLIFLSAAAPARAQQDGDIRDKSGNTIGAIKSNGDVRNGSGNTSGSARGVRPEYAAAFFFFFFKEM